MKPVENWHAENRQRNRTALWLAWRYTVYNCYDYFQPEDQNYAERVFGTALITTDQREDPHPGPRQTLEYLQALDARYASRNQDYHDNKTKSKSSKGRSTTFPSVSTHLQPDIWGKNLIRSYDSQPYT